MKERISAVVVRRSQELDLLDLSQCIPRIPQFIEPTISNPQGIVIETSPLVDDGEVPGVVHANAWERRQIVRPVNRDEDLITDSRTGRTKDLCLDRLGS